MTCHSTFSNDLEPKVQSWGEKIFSLIEASEPPSFFTKKGLSGALMDWAMRDERFKTQLFRFVDVLPTLKSAAEVGRHLKDDERLSAGVRAGLKAAAIAPWLMASAVKAQVTGLARHFMLGDDAREIMATLRGLHERNIAFTVDLLGEAVLSETEADHYAARYLDMLALLARETAGWKRAGDSNRADDRPALNISVKISALYSQIHPADPETAIERISERLRPILRKVTETGALVNFDMESYALKEITLRLFKKAGPAEEPGNFIGPVISRDAQQRILKMTEMGKKEAKLAWQGRIPEEPEEIFGPVLAISKARDFDEALALANTGEFALTGGCFSRSPANIERAKRELIYGNLYINRGITGAIVERQPFGGHRMSGAGTKAGGRDYLLNFMVPRVVTENCLRRGFAPMDEERT